MQLAGTPSPLFGFGNWGPFQPHTQPNPAETTYLSTYEPSQGTQLQLLLDLRLAVLGEARGPELDKSGSTLQHVTGHLT
jgi:hypothetical protein